MNRKCRLMLFFHMHQPFYKELGSKSYRMPWVRLHSLKNYADFPALHLDSGKIKISYNLVPSLIEQIEDYAAGSSDAFESMSRKRAEDLSYDDKAFILSNFFQLNKRSQIDPVPRFVELLALKGSQDRNVSEAAIKNYTSGDYRDLQVLFSLAWSGWLLRDDKEIAALMKKGRGYTEEDKSVLFSKQKQFLTSVLDPYREASKQGLAELTTSPYYHPILPLLCDTNSAKEALPQIELPAAHVQWPDEAEEQLRLGVEKHAEVFGEPPVGMWPSEGSISNEACKLIAGHGIGWAASDKTVLAHSLGKQPEQLSPAEKYSPWSLTTANGPLALFFRDTEFSDLLGFTYQYWQPENAVKDFIGRMEAVTRSFPIDKTPVIPVILDGENAWAYYKDNGREFLSLLFKRLEETPWIETILPGQFIQTDDFTPKKLKSLVAGSWIYGNLSTWIGHREKNKGWELLHKTRSDLNQYISGGLTGENLEYAKKELLIAEGSDWFWWYGDDHETAYAEEFDSLFREHLANVYRFARQEPPRELFEKIKGTTESSGIEPPMRLIRPKLDGRASSYTEWINAGLYFPKGGAEMMHQASGQIKCILFGFDADNIYIRVDGNQLFREQPPLEHVLRIHITSPRRARIEFDFDNPGNAPELTCNGKKKKLDFGYDAHLEFAIPWEACEAEVFAFYAVLLKGDEEVEIHPRGNVITIARSDASYNAFMWNV